MRTLAAAAVAGLTTALLTAPGVSGAVPAETPNHTGRVHITDARLGSDRVTATIHWDRGSLRRHTSDDGLAVWVGALSRSGRATTIVAVRQQGALTRHGTSEVSLRIPQRVRKTVARAPQILISATQTVVPHGGASGSRVGVAVESLRGPAPSGRNCSTVRTARGSQSRGCAFYGAQLTGVDLSGTDLRLAHLAGARLRQSSLVGADLRHAIAPDLASFETDLTATVANGADLRGLRTKQTTLNDIRLNGANLSRAALRTSVLSGAQIRGASLTRATWNRLTATQTDFSRAGLRRLDASRVDLTGVTLAQADLRQATFRRALLADANLLDARLARVTWTDTILSGATWIDGRVCGTPSIDRCAP